MSGEAVCPYCCELIPLDAVERHSAGIDARRLACPHQDISEIRESERPAPGDWGRRVW